MADTGSYVRIEIATGDQYVKVDRQIEDDSPTSALVNCLGAIAEKFDDPFMMRIVEAAYVEWRRG